MKPLKKMAIRTQLYILVGSTIMIIVILLGVVYYQISNVITHNNAEYTSTTISQIRQSVAFNRELFDGILVNIAYDSKVQDFIMEDDNIRKFELYKKISNYGNNIQGLNNGIADIIIIGNNGNLYHHNKEISQIYDVIEKFKDRVDNFHTQSEILFIGGRNRRCFLISLPIYSINPDKISSKNIGIIILVLDSKALGLDADRISPQSATKFYLLDRDFVVYSSNDKEQIGYEFSRFDFQNINTLQNNTIVVDGEESIVRVDDIPEIEGSIISITPKKELLVGLSDSLLMVVKVFLVSIALLSIPFLLVINNIQRPVSKFKAFMTRIKDGDLKGLKERINVEGYAEIEVMGREFNNMLDEIELQRHQIFETSTRLYEAELETKKAEYAYLRSQINPHFLYNTLETIKGIAIRENVPRIMEIAKALGNMFRYSVKGAGIVTLREELEIVKSYIKIQQFRFGDRMHVSLEIDENTLDCRIPKMILQPIVENAIYHGLEDVMSGGVLDLEAAIGSDGILCISVTDNGMGMEAEVLTEISKSLSSKHDYLDDNHNPKVGIGIKNVNNRIKLTYGDEYGITMDSFPSKGTKVVLKIPSGGK